MSKYTDSLFAQLPPEDRRQEVGVSRCFPEQLSFFLRELFLE